MSENLTTKQAALLAAMLEGKSLAEAAAATGANERTARRWYNEPRFQVELQRRTSDALNDASRGMTDAMQGAPAVIKAIMHDEGVAPSVRLQAARILVDSNLRLKDAVEFENRLVALETRLDGNQ